MTITAEQIDAVLPRAATWPPKLYDLTDDDERRHACEWLARIYAEAVPSGPESDQTGPEVAQWPSDDWTTLTDGPHAGKRVAWTHPRVCAALPLNEHGMSTYVTYLRQPDGSYLVESPWPPPADGPHAGKRVPWLYPRPLHGDRWQVRDGRAVVVASNDWPSPAKGTHESDLSLGGWSSFDAALPGEHPESGRGGLQEYHAAEAWSRS